MELKGVLGISKVIDQENNSFNSKHVHKGRIESYTQLGIIKQN